ncbi:MAG: type I-U CRISPR-associated protein Csb2 [Thiohalospira sp.]
MVAIAFRFPAGRYHATPWGRHVNEAEVEWPPSPWRILRALVATFHRKGWADRYDPAILHGLTEALAAELPGYALPPAIRAHSRHYMPQGGFRNGQPETSLVFDAFARLEPTAELVAHWPVSLTEEQRELLDGLLGDLGFLGRAESWVEARLLDGWAGEPDCVPSEIAVDLQTGEAREPVRLLAPVPPAEYGPWRARIVDGHGLDAKRPKKPQRQILATLPEDWSGTLYNETGDLQAAGWSSPPGARFVTYQRPASAFTARPGRRRSRGTPAATTVRLALAGKPLPRLEDALRIGEVARKAAISRSERVNGGHVPAALSGHDLPQDNRHGHAFYLPEDADDDGHIDHILVHAPDGLSPAAVHALDRLTRLWQGDKGEWQVYLEGYGDPADLTESRYTATTREWITVTPYLHPWFAKKRFGVAEQIARECRERGLPEPEVLEEGSEWTGPDGRSRRPVHFHRFRDTPRRLRQPDTRGRFLRLRFPEPVAGPLALGFGCHFGLGVFLPAATQSDEDEG